MLQQLAQSSHYFIENKGGRIVNVSSVVKQNPGGGLLGTAAYASSKAGLNGLTKPLLKKAVNIISHVTLYVLHSLVQI